MINKFISNQENRQFLILLLLFTYILNLEAQTGLALLEQQTEPDTVQVTTPPAVKSFVIDSTFAKAWYKESFKIVPSRVNIYDIPYTVLGNYPNYKQLAINTGVLYGAGFLTLGVLYALPEGATSWNKKEIVDVSPLKRWRNNVKKGPVVDNDNPIFNYILHPYGGAAYYMSARSQGFNLVYSFLYATAVSTFFWEYGIEAFMEIPSIQDLIITPIGGLILGESFYLLKRHLVDNDYQLFGSYFIGNIVSYLIDPVNEVIGLFTGNPNRNKNKSSNSSIGYYPWINTNRSSGNTFGFTVSLTF